ncbi:ABC transporter substrate-binding protein [Spongiactinospora sp. 9N601]|uniref:ABC transporter substrate-binding protein n=1 Tax=Spongiactinospora sp. 9N601 TaxID=3375149 RepID=UPI00379E54B9
MPRIPIGTFALVLLFTAACGGGAKTPSDNVLRIAMVSPGEAQIRVWKDIAGQYEKAHPGSKVELNFQKDTLYQAIGLPSLLNGRKAPDIYFEWAGDRLRTRVKEGFAADLGTQVTGGPLKGLIADSAYNRVKIDGKIVMVPFAADVTNVLWYNPKLLTDAGVQPPKTFDDLLAACDRLNAKGITPITSGNKDLWPAGNWLAHLVSRVVGEQSYHDTLSGKSGMNTPEWERAFGYIAQLRQHKCVNESANAANDNEGAQLFFKGKAAMHPIGSWLVSWAIDEAPGLAFDYVNLPGMPGGAGDQSSVIGVVTGYVVNAKSTKVKESAEFLALANSPANVAAFVKSGTVPLAKGTTPDKEVDQRTIRLDGLLADAKTVVSPPDTGYDLKRADAFYRALAAVLGGEKSPKDALAEAASKAG